MGNFKIGCSPITGKIYAGKVSKLGMWGKIKHDVTDTTVGAVAEHLIFCDQEMHFYYQGKNYALRVVELENASDKK